MSPLATHLPFDLQLHGNNKGCRWLPIALLVVVLMIMLLSIHPVSANMNCIRRACDQEDSLIVCNQSLILISDVTNWRLERDHVALAAMKSRCMGLESCDPSAVCSKGSHGTLFIHYFCEDAKNVFTSPCKGKVFELPTQHGFIQSPNYPAFLQHYRPCRWRIRPPNDSLVVLTLHDVTTSGPREKCDGGLTVSGLECDVLIDHAPRLLCGGDNVSSIVRCGKVSIELSPSKRVYPLRFWVAFQVHPINQPASFTASVLTCSGWIYSTKKATTENVPMVAKETDTHILIILLSVISTLSATLIIVLVIVCMRCRLMRMTVSDHVYSEPSPALQAHYDYISSLETDNKQQNTDHPELAEEYFEVADALPFSMRDTPASPAYAEVEQFIDFKKGQWSSLESTEWADCQSQYSSIEGVGDDVSKPAGSEDRNSNEGTTTTTDNIKKGTGGENQNLKMKNHKSPKSNPKLKYKDIAKYSTTEPKVFVVNLENSKKESSSLCDDTDSSAYEQIEILPELDGGRVVLRNPNDSKIRTKLKEIEPGKSDVRNSPDRIKSPSHGARQKSTSHIPSKPHTPTKSRVDQLKEGLLWRHNEKKEGIPTKTKDLGVRKVSHSPSDTPSRLNSPEERRNRVRGNVDDNTADVTSESKEGLLKNNKKASPYSARLQTSGIVRNGIQKFENN